MVSCPNFCLCMPDSLAHLAATKITHARAHHRRANKKKAFQLKEENDDIPNITMTCQLTGTCTVSLFSPQDPFISAPLRTAPPNSTSKSWTNTAAHDPQKRLQKATRQCVPQCLRETPRIVLNIRNFSIHAGTTATRTHATDCNFGVGLNCFIQTLETEPKLVPKNS